MRLFVDVILSYLTIFSAAEKGSIWCEALDSLLSLYSKDTSFTLDFNSLLDRYVCLPQHHQDRYTSLFEVEMHLDEID